MSAAEIQRINRRVFEIWKGVSHGGIDPEEWESVLAARKKREDCAP